MAHREGMEVSIAVSHAVKLARAEAIAAYPITPKPTSWSISPRWWPTANWKRNTSPWSPSIRR